MFLEVISETDGDDDFKDIVTKRINVLSLRNTEKIEQFLAKGKENITLADLLQIDESQLEGVSNKLRLQLVNLSKEKYREKVIKEKTAKAQDLLVNKENLSDIGLMINLEILDSDLLEAETKEQVSKLLAELKAKDEGY